MSEDIQKPGIENIAPRYFNTGIPGLGSLLPLGDKQADGERSLLDESCGRLKYYSEGGLRIVAHGPPGCGKTLLALQMAFSACAQDQFRVIYLSKDTPGKILWDRIKTDFNLFGWSTEENQPGANGGKKSGETILWKIDVKLNKPDAPKPQGFSVCFLDEMQRKWLERGSESDQRAFLEELPSSFIAFGDFRDMSRDAVSFERYTMMDSFFDSLAYLQPKLKPILSALGEKYKRVAEPDKAVETGKPAEVASPPTALEKNKPEAQAQFFVVVDSMSPSALEQNINLASYADSSASGGKSDASQWPKPVSLFVMESAELPTEVGVVFPPDVQIQLAIRDEAHDVRTRTIQLLKTRFQQSLDELTPFVISGAGKSPTAIERVCKWSGNGEHGHWSVTKPDNGDPQCFSQNRPGIEVMPPFSSEAIPSRTDQVEKAPKPGKKDKLGLKFGIEKLDNEFTEEKSLSPGGCTLLVTQNRCGSTALSLHYLLGQIGDAAKNNTMDGVPKSVLYISFSDDIEEILSTIFHFPALRRAIFYDEGLPPKTALDRLKIAIQTEEKNNSACRHRLFKIPLRHAEAIKRPVGCKNNPDRLPCLYIYLPDFSWITAEEAMEQVSRLLAYETHVGKINGCCHCIKVERIVFDRVGRLQRRWPLVKNSEVFVSGMVALCARRRIEWMLVDDTAEEETETGTFHSHYMSAARNIIRLRRISLYGDDSITIEIVAAGGRIIKVQRPYEIVFQKGASFEDVLAVEDNFKGYTNLSSQKPERCKIKLDLSYDAEQTPLRRDVEAIKQSLQTSMDQIDVRLLGPGTWSGINSAFNTLSKTSRDTCHIVSIDGIWLPSLIRNNVLRQLTPQEFLDLFPEHISDAIDRKMGNRLQLNRKQIAKAMREWYVTETIVSSLAAEKIRPKNRLADQKDGYPDAIPLRNNWGVFAVTRLSRQHIQEAFALILSSGAERNTATLTSKVNKQYVEAALGEGKSKAQLVIDNVIRILTGECEEDYLWGESENPVAKSCSLVYRALWKRDHSNLTWRVLADFREHFWSPFWNGGWFDTLQAEATFKGNKMNPMVFLFPRIDVFGMASTSEESFVSFFLELLLAHHSWIQIFDEDDQVNVNEEKVNVLSFKCDGTQLAHFECCLTLLYRLLAPRQRRQIAIGLRTHQTDIGGGPRDQIPDRDFLLEYADWPRQISLFSREWITTVPDLMPRYDIRKEIEMTTLPCGDRPGKDNWRRILRNEDMDKMKHITERGIPVAGTWYLGILQGGNTDLAGDVIKEIVSREHEMQRYLTRCGAPVSTEIYVDDFPQDANGISQSHTLPYAELIAHIYRKPETRYPDGMFFPFHRTQIYNYLEVSNIIYDLIRQVMRLGPAPEEKGAEADYTAGEPFKKSVALLVKDVFNRLAKHHFPTRQKK